VSETPRLQDKIELGPELHVWISNHPGDETTFLVSSLGGQEIVEMTYGEIQKLQKYAARMRHEGKLVR